MSLPWWWRRAAITLVLVVALTVAITATVTRWQFPFWAPLVGGAILLGVIAVLSASPSSARSRGSARPEGLYASDAYSDAELGRLPPQHPYRDPNESSQVSDLPRQDTL